MKLQSVHPHDEPSKRNHVYFKSLDIAYNPLASYDDIGLNNIL